MVKMASGFESFLPRGAHPWLVVVPCRVLTGTPDTQTDTDSSDSSDSKTKTEKKNYPTLLTDAHRHTTTLNMQSPIRSTSHSVPGWVYTINTYYMRACGLFMRPRAKATSMCY